MQDQDFSDSMDSSAERRRQLLAQLLGKAGIASPQGNQIPRRAVQDEIPLSFAQQRLWLHDQLVPGSSVYNLPLALRLKGPLDVAVLEDALNEIVRRHEALRTTFVTVESGPMQVIADDLKLELRLADLRDLAEDLREATARKLIDEQAQQPFDLSRGPLLSALLLTLDTAEHVLLVTMHHIVTDGWSMGIFMRELGLLYKAFLDGQPSPLPTLPRQYADFTVWQREWLQGETLEKQISYWKQQLDGAPPFLELPTDRVRPLVQTYHGADHSFKLSESLVHSLKELSRQENCTLFMTLLAAFNVLLQRYVSQADIVIGTPIANRRWPEVEGLIGLFINTLVMRTPLDGDPTFREALRRVRKVCLEAYAHQDVPFEKLVEELQPERSLSHSPLFQILFAMQNAAKDDLQLAGLNVSLAEATTGTAQFDLGLWLEETEHGIIGVFQYNTDLFDEQTIVRLTGHFQRLLAAVATNPEQHIGELPLLSPIEKQQLLIEWNETSREYAHDRCIHQLFEEQVERTPDRVAVIFEDEQLTYAELNGKANQLARQLQDLGVGAEILVGVHLERSIKMVVALLGILKAGGAYVPLDPHYPLERLSFMAQDAAVKVLLTEQHLAESLPEQAGQLVCIDQDWEVIAEHSSENLESNVTGENLAYVIYTSGSTGTPKGVLAYHRGAVNRFQWMWRTYPFASNEVCCQKTSLNFVDSVWEIFGPLLKGVSLVIFAEQLTKDPLQFAENCEAHQITRIVLVPSLLRALLESESYVPFEVSSLKYWTLSGEVLDSSLVQKFMQALPGRLLLNLYGSSEVSADSTYSEPTGNSGGQVSIGRPIDNTEVYLLDANLQPVPLGAPGELYIGGAGLARGYLNLPELTAGRFIPHPFSSKPGARLYRTGDLARYLPDGNIDYLGRTDYQVKIRGYRIELGEIEAALCAHPAVREAVVVARAEAPGDKQLVAYLVFREQQRPTSSEMRTHIKERLPEYMIPASFVVLDELPITTNGKVNRKALPPPEMTRSELAAVYVEPRTPVEEILAGIWAQVLRLEQVGIHDHFFELGGHSLLATQVVSRVRGALGIELALRSLFEHPTVAGLSEQVEKQLQSGHERLVSAIEPVSRKQKLPLSFAQQRLWFLDQLLPDSAVYNIPVALRLEGQLNVNALKQTLAEIIRRHEALRTTFAVVEGEPVQVITPAPEVGLSVLDLSDWPPAAREVEAQRLANEAAQQPFDLTRGPLLQTRLLILGPNEHLLLLMMHHIISDGWSAGVLIREMTALYEAFSLGNKSTLPELPIQYADYALWQREWLTGEVFERQLNYWREQLAGAPTVLELPTDNPRPAVQSYRGARHRFDLSKSLTEKLKALSRREDVTLFMTLLAAFQILLYRYTNQSDIVVGTPIANRNRSETEGLIGFFVNTLVLRTNVSGEQTFCEFLERVREVALGAYAHQDVPFEKLVEESQPERSQSHSLLFQVMFVLQNAPASELSLAGLALKPVSLDLTTTKFDISLSIFESDGLCGAFQYSTDLFDASTISRMAQHFETLLEAIVLNPDEKVGVLPLLTSAEQHLLLSTWNQTQTAYPQNLCLHQLFEAQVARSPHAIAVSDPHQAFSFQELNDRANLLGRHLQTLGVGPETRVAVLLPRSAQIIVCILAVLKAGGAYVPLETNCPPERLRFMTMDSGARVLLTSREMLGHLPEQDAEVLLVDEDQEYWRGFAGAGPAGLNCKVEAENAAYVIYTSGSTGKPKGVVIEQRQIINYVWAIIDRLELLPGASFAMVQPLTVDSCKTVIFPSLLTGGTLHVIPREWATDAPALGDYFAAHPIDCLKIAPSHLAALQQSPHPERLLPRRWLVIGGEASRREWAEAIQELAPDCRVFNHYGPTEATVGMLTFPLEKESTGTHSGVMPMGRPLANTQAYLLDREMRPVPIGVAGELYIGGACLARGYLGRPELTAGCFVPSPFSTEPGARLYKTGDMARYLTDGNIEFLGRLDQQVKVRGFRIELGEIEGTLRQHEAVRDVLMVIREDPTGERQLVAYVVARPGAMLAAGELRGYLKREVPDYMIPSAFVLLDALPLTPHGKVDRQALPPPEPLRPELDEEYVAPSTAIELALANIWGQVLKISEVGLRSNFFELGGHSLLATQVISRVREEFRIEIPLSCLFDTPTIEGLSVAVMKYQAESEQRPLNAMDINSNRKEALLLDSLDRLSSEELDSILKSILSSNSS